MKDDKIISNQKMKFVKKLLIVITLLFVFDFAIGSLLQNLFFSQKSGLNYRTTYVLNEVESEIIILGSSRANHHYDPQIFSEIFNNLSCYNAGRDGQHILFQYAMLKGILKRYNPKIIILDILPSQLLKNPKHYAKLSALLPFYDSHKEIREIIESRSKMEKIKLISKIYPFNSLLLSMLKNTKEELKYVNGYIPLKKIMKEFDKNNDAEYEDFIIDLYVINSLESFINESKKAGSKIFLVISPYYTGRKCQEAMDQLRQIADNYDVPLLNYAESQEFKQHPELFQDDLHLNVDGAKLFSTIISKTIKQELK